MNHSNAVASIGDEGYDYILAIPCKTIAAIRLDSYDQ